MCSGAVGMKKRINTIIMTVLFCTPFANANDADVDSALNKTKEGAIELFEIAKQKSAEIGGEILDKGAELGGQANEKAQTSGEAIWDKMKEIGSASKQLAEDGTDKLKDFACDLSDSTCIDAAEKETAASNLDDSI